MATANKSIVVLISGSGSNLQALIDAQTSGQIPGTITGVLSNVADVYGLERAADAGIDTICIDHKQYACREDFDQAMIAVIDAWQPDLVILAGFMRILTEAFVRHYEGRMLNIHPSLLPKYKGLNTHQRAIAAGDTHHGCSVHFVSPELDSGQIIAQGQVAISPEETPESLAAKVQKVEHQIYPLCAEWFCQDRLQYQADGTALLDGASLPPQGQMLNF